MYAPLTYSPRQDIHHEKVNPLSYVPLRYVTLRVEWAVDYSSLIIAVRGQPKLEDSEGHNSRSRELSRANNEREESNERIFFEAMRNKLGLLRVKYIIYTEGR